MSECRVKFEHIRLTMGCANPFTVRAFCKRHGFDFKELIDSGLPIDKLRETGDAMALRICEAAENVER